MGIGDTLSKLLIELHLGYLNNTVANEVFNRVQTWRLLNFTNWFLYMCNKERIKLPLTLLKIFSYWFLN